MSLVDERELLLTDDLEQISSSSRRCVAGVAALELEVGDQPAESQHRRSRSAARRRRLRARRAAPSTDDATEPG